MTTPFCRLQPTNEREQQFVNAVNDRDSAALDELLTQYDSLRKSIDTHWFAFDAPAIVAAKKDEATVKVLLKHGADINARSSWWAGSFGVLDGVTSENALFLLKRGAKFDIHSASEQGELELVEEMIARDESLVNSRGGDGMTPLHVAANTQVAELLIRHGGSLEIRCLDHSATPAQYAVSNPELCRDLISRGATPDIFMACALGDRELVELVIREEPDCLSSEIGQCEHTSAVDPRSSHHIYFWKLLGAKTPLEVARTFDHASLYAELYQRSSPKQQFLAACWDGAATAVSQLIQEHPNLMSQLNEQESRLLARAAWEGRLETVKVMLDVGFDPHLVGDENSTPLDRAAFHGYREIVKTLLENDANPPLTTKNAYGGVPLSCCAYGATHSWKKESTDHLGTIELLLAAGAKIDPSWLPIENSEVDQLFRQHLNQS